MDIEICTIEDTKVYQNQIKNKGRKKSVTNLILFETLDTVELHSLDK